MDGLIDTAGAAKLLGVSKSLLDHDRNGGGLGVPYVKLGGRVLYEPQTLLAWVRARMVHPPAPQAAQAQAEPQAEQPRRRGRRRRAV